MNAGTRPTRVRWHRPELGGEKEWTQKGWHTDPVAFIRQYKKRYGLKVVVPGKTWVWVAPSGTYYYYLVSE